MLEHPEIAVEGVVGTSAGGMNAAVAAYGIAMGGNEGARKALAAFWHRVAEMARWSPLQSSMLDQRGSLDHSPGWLCFDALSRFFSPYELNPANYHPLREVVDFDRLRGAENIKLFLCASNVRTGRLRVFERHEASVEAVLASACLPHLFQAVQIDGEHYWDGGYMGNPPIFPVIYNCKSRDVVLIMINPIVIDEVPRTARAILDRLNTLSFNSSLMREMRAIHFVSRLVEGGFTDGGRLKQMLIHCIDAEDEMRSLSASSKLNADRQFIRGLFELGRARADAFLAEHFGKIGLESSTSINERFL